MACDLIAMGQSRGKIPHSYNSNCKIKIKKTVLASEQPTINEWYELISKESKKAKFNK